MKSKRSEEKGLHVTKGSVFDDLCFTPAEALELKGIAAAVASSGHIKLAGKLNLGAKVKLTRPASLPPAHIPVMHKELS